MKPIIISKALLICFVFLILSSLVYALDYNVQVSSPSSVNKYEGEVISNTFSATITNIAGVCDITCDWSTTSNTHGEGIKVSHDGGQNTFKFDVKAEGNNGLAQYTLTITCKRITGLSSGCWAEGEDPRSFGPYNFRFLYAGDGDCTTEREKCATYQSFLAAPSDCTCSSTTECNPGSNRGADSKGCATFCGNKIAEKQFESCSNCQGDIGKCDGLACLSGGECEGKYCVHEICFNKPYKTSDTFCDKSIGENCKNSGSDCACDSNERCSSSGVCETYCGNGICEQNEQGKCKADCNWCGDGTCQEKESCDSCSIDCGACKKITKEDEFQRNLIKEPINKEIPKSIETRKEEIDNTKQTSIKPDKEKDLTSKTDRPVSKGIVGSNSIESVEVTAEGVGRLVAVGGSLSFKVNGQDHSVIVKEIGKDSVLLTVRSVPFDVSVNKGESKDLDVDGDGAADISVKFNGVFSGKADITLRSLRRKEQRTSIEWVLYLIVIAFILLVIVTSYLFYNKKKSLHKNRHSCSKCYKPLSEHDQEFCHHCGHRLRIVDQVIVEKKKIKDKVSKKKR